MTHEELGVQILLNCRNELYGLFPALDGVFASLECLPDNGTATIVVDGEHIRFSPRWLTKHYAADPARVRRGYLHMLLHCLFLHPFQERKPLWDLACDMAVENIIENAGQPRLGLPDDPVRSGCLGMLGATSAEKLFAMLKAGYFPYGLEEMERAFRFDDHRIPVCGAEKWERILAYTRQNQGNRNPGTKSGSDTEALTPAEKNRFAWRDYLHQFLDTREEITPDPESFDYSYYNLGMEHYGNLPLIEELESREVSRLSELVIAIDTSGSCAKETVEQFLGEMFAILREKEHFFREMKVYLIQCDCCIQNVTLIRSREDWMAYADSVVIQGRGGTDFTPVFDYTDRLIENKELENLKAVLYFTDGDGVYPRSKPGYETAFLLPQDAARPELVPAWATKLLIG